MAPSLKVESPANSTIFDPKAGNSPSSMNGDTTARSDHVQGPNSPVPTVKQFDFKNCTSQEELLGEIIESMRLSGGCVVRNLVQREALQEVETEVRPWLEKAEPWNGEMPLFIFVTPTLVLCDAAIDFDSTSRFETICRLVRSKIWEGEICSHSFVIWSHRICSSTSFLPRYCPQLCPSMADYILITWVQGTSGHQRPAK